MLLINSLVFEASAAKMKLSRPLKPFEITYDISNFSTTMLGTKCDSTQVGDLFAQYFIAHTEPAFLKSCITGLAHFLKNFYYSPALRAKCGLFATCTLVIHDAEEQSIPCLALYFPPTEAFLIEDKAKTVPTQLLGAFKNLLAILIEDYYSERHTLPKLTQIIFTTAIAPLTTPLL